MKTVFPVALGLCRPWDWERVMGDGEHQFSTLKSTVEAIWAEFEPNRAAVSEEFTWHRFCRNQIHLVHTRSYCLVLGISMPKGVSGRLQKSGAVFLVGLAAS
ncbi:hypothetical protein ACNKHM_12355 [Shigella sonnei]